jgi:hypothetical protein
MAWNKKLAALADKEDAVKDDGMMLVFVHGDYRPSRFFFFQLEFFSLLGLSIVSVILDKPSTINTAAIRFGAQVFISVFLAGLFLLYKPFPDVGKWKHAVRLMSLVAQALNASLFFVSYYADATRNPTAIEATDGISIFNTVFTSVMFLVLLFTFIDSLNQGALRESMLNLTARRVRKSGQSEASSQPSKDMAKQEMQVNPLSRPQSKL